MTRTLTVYLVSNTTVGEAPTKDTEHDHKTRALVEINEGLMGLLPYERKQHGLPGVLGIEHAVT